MKNLKQTLSTSILFGSMLGGAVAAGENRPNILLIISDDQGFGEMGAYADFVDPDTLQAQRMGQLRNITEVTRESAPIAVALEAAFKATPNLDRIAAEGTRFTSFYAAPTCAPSRGAMMTAQYPQRHGVYTNGVVRRGPRGG